MKSTVRNFTMPPLWALSLAAALFALPAQALTTGTASNTTISNQATVNFNDAGGVPQTAVVSAAALVTVALVPSAPNVSSPAAVSTGQGVNTTLTYTVTTAANGPDTYTIASGDALSNVTGGTATPSTTTITLGATSLAAAAAIGNTTITVPYDGNASNTSINGLVPGAVGTGSVVVIGGNTYTVTAIVKSPGTNLATLTLDHAIAGTAGALGAVVPEQKTFTVLVAPGTVTTGTSGTDTVTTTVTSNTAPNPVGTQGTPTVVTVNRPTLTVTKQVSVDGGATYTSNPQAAPGTTLTYKITASNTGTSSATSVSFQDAIPQFLTYKAGTGKSASAGATLYSAATGLTDNAGGYTIAGSTVTYTPAGAAGTVAASGVLVLFFQVTIN
jgi:uncharacterized repeat protein (TIGR01451 family)